MATPAAPRGRVRRGAPPTSASAWTGPDARPVCTVSPTPPFPATPDNGPDTDPTACRT